MNWGMSPAHKDLFRKNRFVLVTSMLPEGVISYLIGKKAITSCQAEEINLPTKTRAQTCSTLIDILVRRSDSAYYSFCEALAVTGQWHLRKLMDPHYETEKFPEAWSEPGGHVRRKVETETVDEYKWIFGEDNVEKVTKQPLVLKLNGLEQSGYKLTAKGDSCNYIFPGEPHSFYRVEKVIFSPCYPLMGRLEDRVRTFEIYSPYRLGPRAKELAKAGFFFSGDADECQDKSTCFACGIAVHKWKPKDDIRKEHFKYSPECKYLAMVCPNI